MDAKTIIKKLGGPSAAARFFECRPAAVSQWKRENRIPNARLLHLKAARPDLFDSESRAGIDRRDSERRKLDADLDCDLGEPRDGDRRGNCEKAAA